MKYVVLQISCAECFGGRGESLVDVLGTAGDVTSAKAIAIAWESNRRITSDDWQLTDHGEFYALGRLGEIRIVEVDD